mmetsp:Transcript_10640/g.10711  ORF Transcript_10640/g.10711 Transcript_10640/m.10711 type:complete len:350 (+) Transcript_10640:52-1101(+)|eukprot:CAMPEP_0182427940 /NCGR_PEP_ID=MMETSP1167-20130531/20905_1 /TAXON_ID=2988 /ORGANISM="Mallomonas Sp, Strain CCMP3275" /LENGTH=349 /DNA_ID=CAMNT_0024610545 /DNA_START=51 /DNA_END=1100 /DNA_ORIENTATION=-
MKSTITNTQRANVSMRTGARATVYEVRRDPILKNDNILQERSKKDFPYINGGTYKGQWNQNFKEGFGVQKNADGTKYEGEWKMGKRHGRGTLWIKKHKQYVKQYAGEWSSDRMEGSGFYYYDNGDVYRGSWVKSKRSGHGLMEYPNGDVFEGAWLNDKKHGPGTYYAENGNVYEGNWRNDMKEGPGRFFYASTRKVYEGEWLQDSPKCGEFREPTQDEESLFGEAKIRKAPFNLPDLTLERPQEVLDCAVSATRLDKAGGEELERAQISSEVLENAEKVFMNYVDEGTKTVAFIDLAEVFEALGILLTPELANDIMEQLDIDEETMMSFPEVIDIASFILGGMEAEELF